MTDQTKQSQEAPAAPSMSLTDLSNLREIIRLAQSRGVFRAEEMSMVGQTFDKLNTFLEAVAAAKAAEAEKTEPEETSTNTKE